jgi:hypothetical protein
MPIQIPQLDDRTYQQIVDEAVARIPVHTPEWNNFNHSDPGMTLVQLFAYMTENLLYRSNRIPNANRLKFLSLLRLPLRPASPGYGLVTFLNERGPIEAIPLDKGVELYAGKVPFRTRTYVNILPITTTAFYKRRRELVSGSPEAQRYADLYGALAPNPAAPNFSYYEPVALEPPALGKALPVVDLNQANAEGSPNVAVNVAMDGSLWLALVAPKNVSLELARQALGSQTLSLGIYPDVNMLQRDDIAPDPLEPTSLEAKVTHDPNLVFELLLPDAQNAEATGQPQATFTLLQIESAENVLEMPGIVQLLMPPTEKLGLPKLNPSEKGTGNFPPLVEDRDLSQRIIAWVRISRAEAGSSTAANTDGSAAPRPARISWVGINAARVIQSLQVIDERLGVGTGTPSQIFKAANTPVITEYPLNLETPSNAQVSFQLSVTDAAGQSVTWERVDDIYSVRADATAYTLDPESGQVQCGDGLRGKRFPLGSVIRANYEYGGGLQGQIAINALNKAPGLPNSIKVSNPVATWGASPGDTVEDGERRVSRFLRHRDRLVTAEDFREIARQVPNANIGRTEVLPLFDPREPAKNLDGTVTVMVVPRHPLEQTLPPNPDRLLLDAVCAWLEPRRMVTTRVFVRGPRFVKMFVTAAVELLPGQISAVVNRNVKTALRTYLSPLVGGLPPKGSPTGSGFPLSSELRIQDLEAVVARVDGVRFVQDLQLGYIQPVADDNTESDEGGIVKMTADVPFLFAGLQLPWLVNVHVREGEKALSVTDFGAVAGGSGGPSTSLPVPVRPAKKC